MLRVHDILVWIRIRIRTQILDPDLVIFVIDLQDAKKTNFFLSFSAHVFLKVHLHNFTTFFKDKKPKRSHKTVGIKVLLTIFAS